MTKSRAVRVALLISSLTIIVLSAFGAVYWWSSVPREYLSDKNVIIDQKVPSPDGSKVLIQYRYDLGGLGYGAGRDALVPANQLSGNLRKFILPQRYSPLRWEPDGSLTVEIDCIERIRADADCSETRNYLFGTNINVQSVDETLGKDRVIEADLPSPNGQQRLVAYRYPNGSNLGRIHVSFVESDQPIPQYGNFYIASMGGDGLLGARWESDSSIVFFTKTSQRYLLQDLQEFRPGNLNIHYRIQTDDHLPYGYLWTKVLSNR